MAWCIHDLHARFPEIPLAIGNWQQYVQPCSDIWLVAQSALACIGPGSGWPPSLWFNPEQPLAFGLMACLVLGLSVTAATLFKGLLSAMMDAAQSGTLSAPSSPKQSDTPKLGEPRISHELIEMHARAVEVHSPVSSASAVST